MNAFTLRYCWVFLFLILFAPLITNAETLKRVSVSSAGSQANGSSGCSVITPDGQYIAFISLASNLIPGDNNNESDVFLHNTLTGKTKRINVASNGDASNKGTGCHVSRKTPLAISSDGRYIAFVSLASNLASNDTNGTYDIFVHDAQTGITQLVSRTINGSPGNAISYLSSMSADGRYIAFHSKASDLVPNDINGNILDAYVHDRITGETQLISVSSTGSQFNAASSNPALNSDGRYVAFYTDDAGGAIYVYDRLLSLSEFSTNVFSYEDWEITPNISPDGRYIVYRVPPMIILHDRNTGATEPLIKVDDEGGHRIVETNFSPDGRYLIFSDTGRGVMPWITHGFKEGFIYNFETRKLEQVCVQQNGQLGCPGDSMSASSGGRYVVLNTGSSLVSEDTNALSDVYVIDRGPMVAATVDQIYIDHNWKTVQLPVTYQDPVVIISPPTSLDKEPGVVRLRNISGNTFEIKLQEWKYLDGIHNTETVSYLVIERGRYELPNGSVWEAGAFLLSDTGVWSNHKFTKSFVGSPAVFLTAQSFNGHDPITVRARNLSNSEFQAALFEEEALMEGHAVEEIGYLAVTATNDSGDINLDSGRVSFVLRTESIDDISIPVLFSSLKLEEEVSIDAETTHTMEDISILALGNALFAQDISSNGSNVVAPRVTSVQENAEVEWGTIAGVNHNWIKVPLSKTYDMPVIIVRPVSNNGKDSGVVRIRNITSNSFELKYQEWDYLDRRHPFKERVFYLVAEEGKRSIAGLTVDAGVATTVQGLNNSSAQPYIFSNIGFADIPALFTSVLNVNGDDPVTTRTSNITARGFDIMIQGEEAKDNSLPASWQSFSWIAMQVGSGVTSNSKTVSVFNTQADHNMKTIMFSQMPSHRFPVIVGDITSTNGNDPVILRYQNLGTNRVDIYLQEEQSQDVETSHALETVSVFIAD